MEGEYLMEALIRIQKELKVPKERYNRFGEFYYRNAEDVLKAVKPLLKSETLVCTTEIKLFGSDVYFGVTTTLRSGEHCESTTGWAREEKTRPKMGPGQLSGAADSYAKKRALDNLFMLDDGVDADHPMPPQDDGGPADWTPPPKRGPKPATEAGRQYPANWIPTPGPQPATEPHPWDGPPMESPPSDPPPSEPPPPAATEGKREAATPDQRKWLKMLWDYYVMNSNGRLKAEDKEPMKKLMDLAWLHKHRYPSSISDVEDLRGTGEKTPNGVYKNGWIKVEELCV